MDSDNSQASQPGDAASALGVAERPGARLYLLALAGAVAYGLTVFVTLHFIPWIWDMHYELLRRFVLFGVGVLAVVLSSYAHRHKGPRFWVALALVAALYSISASLFIHRVGDLGPRSFAWIAGLELGAGYFFIDWFTRQGDVE